MDWSSIAVRADAILNARIFAIAGTDITLFTLLAVILVITGGLWLARLASAGTARALHARGVTDIGTIATARRVVHYIIVLVVFLTGLQTVGINLNALFAAGAFFAIAAGLAVQNLAQNLIAGMMLLADRTIRIGDVLEVEGRVVRVTRMGMRATIARTRDEEDVILPNATLVQNSVINYTLGDRNYRIKAEFGVAHGSDLDVVVDLLERTAAQLPWAVPAFKPRVLLVGLRKSSIDFQVHVWIDDPWSAQRRTSELNLAIWRAFRDAGIVVAFPQLDIHFDPPFVDAADRLLRAG